jgi:hypothetical protein
MNSHFQVQNLAFSTAANNVVGASIKKMMAPTMACALVIFFTQ